MTAMKQDAMEQVVVYGGSGFLGSHVADALTGTGYQVRIFDCKPSLYLKNSQQMIVGDIMNYDAVVKAKDLSKIEKADVDNIKLVDNPHLENTISRIIRLLNSQIEELTYEQEREVDRVKRGDELPPGVLKKVDMTCLVQRYSRIFPT